MGGTLAKNDSYNLQFLESSGNVRQVIADALGREPNAEIAKGIATCIQQGRMFFESASNAEMEIRPLLLYYGMMAFAKSVISGRGLRSLTTLNQGHGLHDVSSPTSRLTELVVKIGNGGTFQEFNDVIREYEGLDYFEESMSRRLKLQTTASAHLINNQFSLKEILARIPGLENLFQATFKEEAGVLRFTHFIPGRLDEEVILRIDVPDLFEDRESLKKIIEEVRGKYPTLKRWRFSSAEKAWDNSVIIFHNVAPEENELASENFMEENGGRRLVLKAKPDQQYVDFRQLLDSVIGGLTQSYPSLSKPINGAHLSDVSLQYAGMFLLSSLVRYRPQIWVHSVSRFASQERPADDQSLALIESFMDTVQSTYPKLVTRLLTEP